MPSHRPIRSRLHLLFFTGLLWAFPGWPSAEAQHLYPGILDEIHTVLPLDAIPAIDNPEFVAADLADIDEDAPVIGLSVGDESHAYSMYLLNGHEIVNDWIGGQPIATTW